MKREKATVKVKQEIEWKFQGVWIPRKLWLCEELSLLEKCTLILINSYDNEKHCWASNKYLAEQISRSAKTVSTIISKLKRLGLIKELRFDGRKRFLKVSSKGEKLLK